MIFVTGGAGFIGSSFVLSTLARTGTSIVNLDKLTYAGNLRNLESLQGDSRHVFVRGDICDRELVRSLLSTHRPRANAASKAAADHLVRAYFHTYGLPALITNCSNNYGPLQFPEKLVPLMIRSAVAGEPLPVYGDGRNVRDWLYVDDHCDAIRAVLERGRVGETYNIGGESERANIDVVRALCALLDEARPRKSGRHADLIAFVQDRPGHDLRYAMDISKIRRELGWQPKESFESGLKKTVHWYLEHMEKHFAPAAA